MAVAVRQLHERCRAGRCHDDRASRWQLTAPTRGASVIDARLGNRVHLDLDIGGRVRRLRVERRDGQYHVAVDDRVPGRPAAVDRETLSLLVQEGDGPIRGVDATIGIRPGSSTLDVSFAGHTLPATLVSRFGARAAEGGAYGNAQRRDLADAGQGRARDGRAR